jgi:flagellar biogenesis protein FliO
MSFEFLTGLPGTVFFGIFALILTLVIAWGVLRAMSAAYKSRVANGEISVQSAYSLGVKQHLYVVNFRGSDYFLAVTSDRISVIDSRPESEGQPERQQN